MLRKIQSQRGRYFTTDRRALKRDGGTNRTRDGHHTSATPLVASSHGSCQDLNVKIPRAFNYGNVARPKLVEWAALEASR